MGMEEERKKRNKYGIIYNPVPFRNSTYWVYQKIAKKGESAPLPNEAIVSASSF